MKTAKTMTVPIAGRTAMAVLGLVRRVLGAKDVQSFAITQKGIEVVQLLEEGEAITIFDGSDDIDFGQLLSVIPLETQPYDASQHGVHALYTATHGILTKRCIPCCILAPSWGLLSAWLDVPKGEKPPTHVFGLRLYIVGAATNDRVIVLGAPHNIDFLSDATVATAIDMGV